MKFDVKSKTSYKLEEKGKRFVLVTEEVFDSPLDVYSKFQSLMQQRGGMAQSVEQYEGQLEAYERFLANTDDEISVFKDFMPRIRLALKIESEKNKRRRKDSVDKGVKKVALMEKPDEDVEALKEEK